MASGINPNQARVNYEHNERLTISSLPNELLQQIFFDFLPHQI